jgi:hypothetical protein
MENKIKGYFITSTPTTVLRRSVSSFFIDKDITYNLEILIVTKVQFLSM